MSSNVMFLYCITLTVPPTIVWDAGGNCVLCAKLWWLQKMSLENYYWTIETKVFAFQFNLRTIENKCSFSCWRMHIYFALRDQMKCIKVDYQTYSHFVVPQNCSCLQKIYATLPTKCEVENGNPLHVVLYWTTKYKSYAENTFHTLVGF